ncbi:DUF6410 domain-containing protein [Streptomyces sp. NEAU-W12]|uniref:DUF6410 domain-containing protein n=1 Tax=Streptomyces sp. NEAU-W12 TaxID=2994668 RepID=UPI00224A8C8E|nr:DUF6410 domain-containing protein [Streptomyces sp. NEAU-W12]MCX2923049.1 hypothetical protein [Streptomyces sp. NEAU-W12]
MSPARTPGVRRAPVLGRDAGPVGRAVRVAAGGAALTHLLTTKAPDHGGGALLAAAATAVALAAGYTGLLLLLRPLLTRGARHGLAGWPGGALLLLPMLLYPIGVLPDAPALGVALYVELSVLTAGITGYGGIELAAPPALLLGRRPVLYGPFNAVDLAERGMRRPWHAAPERTAGWLAAAGLAWFWVVPPLAAVRGGSGDAFDALGVLDPAACGALVTAGVLLAVPAPGPARLRRLRAGAFVLLGLGGAVGALPDVLWPVVILTGLVTGALRLAPGGHRDARVPATGAPAPGTAVPGLPVTARPHVETSSTTR